ncbi:hypothetical protein H4582DRAFT_742869 [Lactarius indigo]|nr:hypothetical protein H4582DRAFT_742869 [Lactarius indigo]
MIKPIRKHRRWMIVEATPAEGAYLVSRFPRSSAIRFMGARHSRSAEWQSTGRQQLSMTLVVPQWSRVCPRVKASLHQALCMFNMLCGRAFKSRGYSVQRVNITATLILDWTGLATSFSAVWRHPGGWLPPVHLPMLSDGGILPSYATSNLQSLADCTQNRLRVGERTPHRGLVVTQRKDSDMSRPRGLCGTLIVTLRYSVRA